MKSYYIFLKVIVMNITICIIELYFSYIKLFSNNIFIKNLFLYFILVTTTIFTYSILNTSSIKRFFAHTLIAILAYLLANKIIDFRLIIGVLLDLETVVLGVNFMGGDIWFYHYVGIVLGVIISMLKTCKSTEGQR